VLRQEKVHHLAVFVDGTVQYRHAPFRHLAKMGVIALFPRRRSVSLRVFGGLQGAPFGGMVEVFSNHHASHQEPLYGPYYADKGPVDNPLAAFGGATLRLARL
jgi:hypothetical protein